MNFYAIPSTPCRRRVSTATRSKIPSCSVYAWDTIHYGKKKQLIVMIFCFSVQVGQADTGHHVGPSDIRGLFEVKR